MSGIGLTLDSFQKKLDSMYGKSNNEREFEYFYSYLCRSTSYLSRTILRTGNSNAFFVKSFSWLITIATSLDINLETAFRKKFPAVCPYCIGEVCECSETHKTPINNIPVHRARDDLKERYYIDINRIPHLNIDDAVKRMAKIYPANKAIWKAFGSFFHFSRLFEEVGEVHEAYTAYKRDGQKTNLEEELADVFAWLLSAWEIHTKGQSLSDAVLDYYIDGCPVCKKEICECKAYSDRPQAIAEKSNLRTVKEHVEEILKLNPQDQSELKALLASLDEALTNDSTTDAKRVLNSLSKTLNTIQSATAAASETTNNAKNILSAIQKTWIYIDQLKDTWLN